MSDRKANAGVHAQNGFALQRNLVLYLLLESYKSDFKGKKYFIYSEHHEDFLFCFLNDDEQSKMIKAYQSKKNSKPPWTISNKDLKKSLSKLLTRGQELLDDQSIPKAIDYMHQLSFISNSDFEFKSKESHTCKINETNALVQLKSLPKDIIESLLGVTIDLFTAMPQEANNMHLRFVDFPKVDNEQKEHLVGKITVLFGDKIYDCKAAVDTIISLLQKLETTYNQGGIIRLDDKTKRISNDQIDTAMDLITARSKAFKYWRDKSDDIRDALTIRPYDEDKFKLYFGSAFDFFRLCCTNQM